MLFLLLFIEVDLNTGDSAAASDGGLDGGLASAFSSSELSESNAVLLRVFEASTGDFSSATGGSSSSLELAMLSSFLLVVSLSDESEPIQAAFFFGVAFFFLADFGVAPAGSTCRLIGIHLLGPRFSLFFFLTVLDTCCD